MHKVQNSDGEIIHLALDPVEDPLSLLERHIKDKVGFPNAALVVQEIARIAKEIPSSVNSLSPDRARELAGTFLKGMDLCGELYAVAIAYELKMELFKKKEHAEALVIRSIAFNCKTSKDKEAYADIDKLYLEAADKFIEAKMFRILVENKREDFSKAHYLMRKVADEDVIVDHTDSPTEGFQGSWDGTPKRHPL